MNACYRSHDVAVYCQRYILHLTFPDQQTVPWATHHCYYQFPSASRCRTSWPSGTALAGTLHTPAKKNGVMILLAIKTFLAQASRSIAYHVTKLDLLVHVNDSPETPEKMRNHREALHLPAYLLNFVHGAATCFRHPILLVQVLLVDFFLTLGPVSTSITWARQMGQVLDDKLFLGWKNIRATDNVTISDERCVPKTKGRTIRCIISLVRGQKNGCSAVETVCEIVRHCTDRYHSFVLLCVSGYMFRD